MRRDETSTEWSTDPKELPEEANDALFKILAIQENKKGGGGRENK